MAEVGELPLHEPAVTAAPRADAAVAPLLLRGPGQRVVRVDTVLLPRREGSARLVAAAAVDDDRRVAAPREPDAPRDEALARRLVRRPLHDRRQRPGPERQVD